MNYRKFSSLSSNQSKVQVVYMQVVLVHALYMCKKVMMPKATEMRANILSLGPLVVSLNGVLFGESLPVPSILLATSPHARRAIILHKQVNKKNVPNVCRYSKLLSLDAK